MTTPTKEVDPFVYLIKVKWIQKLLNLVNVKYVKDYLSKIIDQYEARYQEDHYNYSCR